ncbi:uncharacterized protein DMAD_08374 [Drosophila madeirensis]
MFYAKTLRDQNGQDEAESHESVETAIPPQAAGPEHMANNRNPSTFSLSALEDPELNTPLELGLFYEGDYTFCLVLPPRMLETHSLTLEECYYFDPVELARTLLTRARSRLVPKKRVRRQEIDSVALQLCMVMKLKSCEPQLVRRPIHGHLLVACATDRDTGKFNGCFIGHMEPNIKLETSELEFRPKACGICTSPKHYDIAFKTTLHFVRLVNHIIVE